MDIMLLTFPFTYLLSLKMIQLWNYKLQFLYPTVFFILVFLFEIVINSQHFSLLIVPYSPLLSFKFMTSFFINCHCLHIWIWICISICKYILFMPQNGACMNVFRADHLTLLLSICLTLTFLVFSIWTSFFSTISSNPM